MNGAKVMKINNKLDYIRDERDDFKTYLNKAVYYGNRGKNPSVFYSIF